MGCRVLLIEDSAAVRGEIIRVLAGSCEVVGFADDGRDAVAAAEAHRPDVVLLDISLPGISGMAVLPLLRAMLPDAMIVMLTNHASEQYVEEALRRGANSYVLKSEAHERLLSAVRGSQRGTGVSTWSALAATTLRTLLPG